MGCIYAVFSLLSGRTLSVSFKFDAAWCGVDSFSNDVGINLNEGKIEGLGRLGLQGSASGGVKPARLKSK